MASFPETQIAETAADRPTAVADEVTHPERADFQAIDTPSHGESASRIAQPDQFRYSPDDRAALIGELRQLPALLLDIASGLLLMGETSEAVSELILRQADRGGLQDMSSYDLLYRVEFLRRYVGWLEQKWTEEHPGSAGDQDALADHVRRSVRGRLPDNPSNSESHATQGPKIAGGEESAVPELFSYQRGQTQELLQALNELPSKTSTQITGRLAAGDCSEKVTKWLMKEASCGDLQNLSYHELLYRIECKRRYLFGGLSGYVGFLEPPRHNGAADNPNQLPAHDARDRAADKRRRTLLLWEISQLPDPLFTNLLRLLMEGGRIADCVLRITARLSHVTETARDAQPDGTSRGGKKRKNAEKSESAFRAEKGDGMLRTLGELPTHLLQEAINLLARRTKATVVANFILSHEDLGNCPRVSENTMRQYMQHLRRQVLGEVKPEPTRKRFLHQVAKHIQQQQRCTHTVMVARQALSSDENERNGIRSVPEVESLASIKTQLEKLFRSDLVEVLEQLMTLRRSPALRPLGSSQTLSARRGDSPHRAR